jgi:hypothetical protein
LRRYPFPFKIKIKPKADPKAADSCFYKVSALGLRPSMVTTELKAYFIVVLSL